MKCRWRKDSDALIRRNGVVAEAGREGLQGGTDGQEGQLCGRVSVGEYGVACVVVVVVVARHKRQKRKKPIRVVACAACGCHCGRGRVGGGESQAGAVSDHKLLSCN